MKACTFVFFSAIFASSKGLIWKEGFRAANSFLYELTKVKMTELLLLEEYSSILKWPRGYKAFSMLNSAEHEISVAHKYKNIKKYSIECYFSCS